MGKIAFVFPGQGAQHPGMGQNLYENSPAAKEAFDLFDSIRPGTCDLCFLGSAQELAETVNTQPCMFACELAAALSLKERGIQPHMVAGFSLGEIAALTFSGAVSLEDGFRLVCRRAELMQIDAEKVDSAMAAVLKLENEVVEQICAQIPDAYPVNYNCPGQVTVACLKSSLDSLSAAVKQAGGRALPLKVRGGFHSPFMSTASTAFSDALDACTINAPAIPLYSNYTGLPYEGDPRLLLSRQIANPVRWEGTIRHMLTQGIDTFVEVGPGNVLTGLIKKIAPEAHTINVADFAQLEEAIKELPSC